MQVIKRSCPSAHFYEAGLSCSTNDRSCTVQRSRSVDSVIASLSELLSPKAFFHANC